jgi:hypothetical protein
MKTPKPNLEAYFKERNKNTGRVKHLGNGLVTVNIAKSWGIGDFVFEMNQCIDFTPKLDDRVFLCRNEHGIMFITKMKKSRQEGTIWTKSPKRRLVKISEPL